MRSQYVSGVVALEFLLILPLIIGLLYAGLVYGVLFLSKVELQRAADGAAASVYYLDRRNLNPDDVDGFEVAVRDHAETALERSSSLLSRRLLVDVAECETPGAGDSAVDVVLLKCNISVIPSDGRVSFLPQLNMSFLGSFPPQPATLSATAAVTF